MISPRPRKKILIIEDDTSLTEELSEILQDKGYSVDTENNGLTGRKRLEDERFDILILDLRLPGLAGEEILRQARGKNLCEKIIVLSAKPVHDLSMPHPDIESSEPLSPPLDQADFVINKPFRIKDLFQALKRLS
ncbi:MAG: response regulator [Candidatus Omnitrophica bacterium]|nr:response regulator [Candidatus Omnitrophota bacterium]